MITNGAKNVAENTGEGEKFIMYLKDIETAMLNVDQSYYVHKEGNTDESGFTGRFLYCLQLIQKERIEADPNTPYSGIQIGYDQDKDECHYLSLICDYISDRKIRESIEKRNRAILAEYGNLDKNIRPDFILHKPGNLDRQEYCGEIKMQGNQDTLDDLEKISEWMNILEEAYASKEYMANNLDPRYGLYIFLYVYNEDIKTPTGLAKDDSLKARLSRMEDHSKAYTYSRNIICFSLIDGSNRRVICQTLGEILDEIEWYKVTKNN